jgi:truncated hemoglobin YjbI
MTARGDARPTASNNQRHPYLSGCFDAQLHGSIAAFGEALHVIFPLLVARATGGPVHYDGKEMKSAHAGMHIGNPEFDATLGDLKASLGRLQIPNKEQKELLSIIESTRPQIVTQR